jgi:hypothetical protein
MKNGKSEGKFSSERNGGKANPAHVTINLTAGPTSPAQKQAWRRFWAKLIAEVKQGATEDNSSSDSTR